MRPALSLSQLPCMSDGAIPSPIPCSVWVADDHVFHSCATTDFLWNHLIWSIYREIFSQNKYPNSLSKRTTINIKVHSIKKYTEGVMPTGGKFFKYCFLLLLYAHVSFGEGAHAMACVWTEEDSPIGFVFSSYLYVGSRVILGAWWQIPLPTMSSCWPAIHIEDSVSLLAHDWTLEFYPHFLPYGCILVWCAYVCGDERFTLSVISSYPLLYFLRQVLSLSSELTV